MQKTLIGQCPYTSTNLTSIYCNTQFGKCYSRPRGIMLSIVIVNYNAGKMLKDCVDSIYRESLDTPFDVWVVDNDSRDDSIDTIKQSHPSVRIIENKINVGFAAANNIALSKSKSDYFLLLNPDTFIRDNAIEKVVGFMNKNSDVGIAGCRVLNVDETLQLACRRSIPTPGVAFFRLSGLSKLFPNSKIMATYNLTYLDPDQANEVDAVSGAFLIIRKKVVDKIGLLDEKFFMYGEELDWCFRAKKAGWKVMYYPEAEIIHYKGECSKFNSRKAAIEFYRSMYLFHKKHFAENYNLFANLIVYIGIAVKALSSWKSILFSAKVGSKK